MGPRPRSGRAPGTAAGLVDFNISQEFRIFADYIADYQFNLTDLQLYNLTVYQL